jgi:hypothetical protein
MLGRSTSHNPYRGPAIIMQGLRPHWLRSALLLLLVAVVFFLPSIYAGPGLVASSPVSLPLVGSVQPISRDQTELDTAISRANAAFRDARAHADPVPLDGVATGAWLDDERRQIADLRAKGTTERWTPRSIRLTAVAMHDKTATVCSDEYWDKEIVDADGRAGPAETYHHIEQYILIRGPEGWLVSAINYSTEQCRV